MTNNNKKILVGVATNGKGGVDSYILSFVKIANKNNIECHVLTTNFSKGYEEKLKKNNAILFEISNLHNKTDIAKTITELNNKNNYYAAYWNISTCLMYPYVKASSDCKIQHIVVHAHAHYNNQSNAFKTAVFDMAHYYYRNKLSKLNVKYAACAKECARWIAGDKNVEDNKWTFVPNPIDNERCQYNKETRNKIRKELNIECKFVIGCATSFMHYKNPLYLIELFSKIHKQESNAFLLLAGDGPMRNEVETLAEGLLTPGSYKLLGHVNNVPDLLQAFDCFVLPSKNEGLPLCILEAQASSLPCFMSTNITKEAIVNKDLVKRISFDKGIDYWSNEILKVKESKHKRSKKDADIVSEAGFNLNSPEKVLPLLGF